MKIDIRGDKIKVTEAIKSYVEEKLGRLEKYFKNESEISAFVVIKVQGNNQIIEVTIPNGKLTLRCEEKHNDLYAAIDNVIDKLERQIRKNKSKIKKHYKETINFEELNDDIEEDTSEIVKRKEVELIPMSESEAILQMELTDHDFYLFNNRETNKTSVIYKRKDKSYGIISGE